MKKNFLLLSTLVALAASASGQTTNDNPICLPAFTVTVERRNDAEKAIDASLSELKESARSFPLMLTGRTPPESNIAGKNSAPKAPATEQSAVTYRVAIKA